MGGQSDCRQFDRGCVAVEPPVFAEFETLSLLRDLPAGFGGLVKGFYGLGAEAPNVVFLAGLRWSPAMVLPRAPTGALARGYRSKIAARPWPPPMHMVSSP